MVTCPRSAVCSTGTLKGVNGVPLCLLEQSRSCGRGFPDGLRQARWLGLCEVTRTSARSILGPSSTAFLCDARMHLTKFTDNALRCLVFLGSSESRTSTVREIAERMGMSPDHLTKVVQRLASLGVVETTRGVGGGVRLVRDPADVRLGHVVRETEQSFALVECFDAATNQCPIAPVCALPPILDEALEAFLAVLDRRTLADLLHEPRRLRRAVGLAAS